jgi:hypothetical protein
VTSGITRLSWTEHSRAHTIEAAKEEGRGYPFSGNMASAIGIRAAKHAYTIEIISRNTATAQALADQIGSGATVGTFGARPAGDIVIVAVLYAGAVDVVAHYGEALSGKILIDITNPFNADASGLVTAAGDSVSQQMADVTPEGCCGRRSPGGRLVARAWMPTVTNGTLTPKPWPRDEAFSAPGRGPDTVGSLSGSARSV